MRQLESLIRLSEAIAKINFSSKVLPEHVKQAFELFANSMVSIHHEDQIIEEEEEQEIEEKLK